MALTKEEALITQSYGVAIDDMTREQAIECLKTVAAQMADVLVMMTEDPEVEACVRQKMAEAQKSAQRLN